MIKNKFIRMFVIGALCMSMMGTPLGAMAAEAGPPGPFAETEVIKTEEAADAPVALTEDSGPGIGEAPGTESIPVNKEDPSGGMETPPAQVSERSVGTDDIEDGMTQDAEPEDAPASDMPVLAEAQDADEEELIVESVSSAPEREDVPAEDASEGQEEDGGNEAPVVKEDVHSSDVPADVPATDEQPAGGGDGGESGQGEAGNTDTPGEDPLPAGEDGGNEDKDPSGTDPSVPEEGSEGSGTETSSPADAAAEEGEKEDGHEEKEEKDKAEDTDKKDDKEADKKPVLPASPVTPAVRPAASMTRDQFISSQTFADVPDYEPDFRFRHVDVEASYSGTAFAVMEERDSDSRIIGRIPLHAEFFILKEFQIWIYIESGDVRGFVRKDKVIYEEKPEEDKISVGYTTMDPEDNKAFTFTKKTARKIVDKKDACLITRHDIVVYEEMDKESRVIGTLHHHGVGYFLQDEGDSWWYMESGDVRGFVRKGWFLNKALTEKAIARKSEDDRGYAETVVEPEENRALYHTVLSVKDGNDISETRQKLLEYASSFIGRPYVWGGNDPHTGADCSGFVKYLYASIGIQLPRVAADQAQKGLKIKVEDAAPGDLIFFARNGYIYHVAMYAGDGRTVEALGRNYGIVSYHLSGRDSVWATRLLDI